ncbi:class I SAM-dependent methyltransferase [Conexibacter woesei]|uniref:Methyltransferase type 12 n=1 Tax=Conexibacter woesei (strain DSM 14684 / CCUG 47730 / CIP 108061 / JCM 11494 / NBRC 100937 / ID131577) TaxID=469383 RepID=D3EZP0_CONWI|nr:class I SAM-dependent methyltransferase [Conexibacter woesei]ADB53878.1 Methyltransferase type 12 [Conexibacter woesei DSM 14684]
MSSVDDWDKHWSDYSDAVEHNPAQDFRRRLVISLLERSGQPRRLLDVGSGTGDLMAVARTCWPQAELVGAEISKGGVRISREKVPSAEFHVVDLLDGSPPPAGREHWATHAVCSEVLEHVDDPTGLLVNARAWLAPGCHLVVTVPGGPMSAFDRHIGHRRHFTPVDLAAILGRAGYDVELCGGAGFPFFNLYRSAVIARGDRLITDVSSEQQQSLGLGARLTMTAFGALFRLNLPVGAHGWQTVAVARLP